MMQIIILSVTMQVLEQVSPDPKSVRKDVALEEVEEGEEQKYGLPPT